MAADAESEDCALSIRFVDESDFKEISVQKPSSGRCWKKNRPSWFRLKDKAVYSSSEAESCEEQSCESSSEEDETQSVIGSDADCDAHVEIESDSHESFSSSLESSDEEMTRKSKKASTKQRPKSSTSKEAGSTKQQKVSKKDSRNKSISEEDLEELCGMLEEKREELDRLIKQKMESSTNLEFYPLRTVLRKALLAVENNKDVLAELTGDFIRMNSLKLCGKFSLTECQLLTEKLPWPMRGQINLAISERFRPGGNCVALSWPAKFPESTKLQCCRAFMKLSMMPRINLVIRMHLICQVRTWNSRRRSCDLVSFWWSCFVPHDKSSSKHP